MLSKGFVHCGTPFITDIFWSTSVPKKNIGSLDNFDNTLRGVFWTLLGDIDSISALPISRLHMLLETQTARSKLYIWKQAEVYFWSTAKVLYRFKCPTQNSILDWTLIMFSSFVLDGSCLSRSLPTERGLKNKKTGDYHSLLLWWLTRPLMLKESAEITFFLPSILF